jgi:hypothetical protein
MIRKNMLKITPSRMLSLCALGIVLALTSPAYALYLFYMRQDLRLALDSDPDSLVGKQVTFTDRLVRVWPEARERPNSVGGESYVVFDTEFFHCAVPESRLGTHLKSVWETTKTGYAAKLKDLEAINDEILEGKLGPAEANDRRTAILWEMKDIWYDMPIVTVMGTVDRAEFWGAVQGAADTEVITIVCDEVQKPRDRWYFHGLDE